MGFSENIGTCTYRICRMRRPWNMWLYCVWLMIVLSNFFVFHRRRPPRAPSSPRRAGKIQYLPHKWWNCRPDRRTNWNIIASRWLPRRTYIVVIHNLECTLCQRAWGRSPVLVTRGRDYEREDYAGREDTVKRIKRSYVLGGRRVEKKNTQFYRIRLYNCLVKI